MKNNLILLLLMVFGMSFSQEKIIHGKVTAAGGNVEGINVINLVNEKATVTDSNGEFQILAKAEDLLVLTAINFEYKRRIIEQEDISSGKINITMETKVGQLDEVEVVKYKDLNAVSLGILDKPAKVYTPAERRLYTAQSTKLDYILNALSGRSGMIKKEIIVEKKISLMEILEDLYEDKYFIETLKIPAEYVKAFQYFAVEDDGLAKAIKAKNTNFIELSLIQIAPKYLQLLADEK